jgi:type I restriction enzyme M protein
MSKTTSGANLGFENRLWEMADKMRGHMDSSEYKHVVLGLIFLKYISDAFQAKYDALSATKDSDYTDPEDRDEYSAVNVFWVVPEARWDFIQNSAMSGHTNKKTGQKRDIGKIIDDAMVAIEKENPTLKGVLPKDYSRPALDKHRLGELVTTVGNIELQAKDSGVNDPLGRVYEYFLGRFAAAEGKGGGEFYTPQCVVQLLVRMIEPYKGRVFDPCCGSGGMFVQSEHFVERHGGRIGDIAVYGQESNPTTWKLAKMNLAIRGIDANLGPHQADSFHNDLHKDLKADFILANPPFNMSDWGGERLKDDVRWKLGPPPKGNANFAWVQHMAHHLAPNGKAGFVLANGSLSSNQRDDAQIRKALVEDDLVDCIVYLPPQLFYTTQISVSLWFLARNKSAPGERSRKGETLFVYAYDLGQLTDRTHRELSDDELEQIAGTYRRWRGVDDQRKYRDISGFCRAARNGDIEEHAGALVPGRYVGFDRKGIEAPGTIELRQELDEIRTRLEMSHDISRLALNVFEEVLSG